MSQSTRQAFGETLVQLGVQHPEIVVLDADLSKSTKSDLFAKQFPHRFFEMGISEANMIGTAAGLALTGRIPFACSFGCFLTGRFDTIRMSIAYSQIPVRLVGTHAGIGIGDDGHSQMGLEDIALMRTLPTMGVFQPMDAVETAFIMKALCQEWKGPAYLRLTRQNLPRLYPKDAFFSLTRLMKLYPDPSTTSQGSISCLATGACVSEAMQAAQELQQQGIQMEVWNVHCLKPFDQATTQKIAQSSKLMITVEDHSTIGGLGSCVAETLSKLPQHAPLIQLGIQDTFGESGQPQELYEKFGISKNAILASVRHHHGL